MEEVMKVIVTSFKRSLPHTSGLSAPSPEAGPCPPMPPWESLGYAWTSVGQCLGVLWGHCSFLLDTGVHKVLFVPSKSLFTQSCVSSGGSIVGLMVTSSKSTYATPKSAAPRAPAPAAGHC